MSATRKLESSDLEQADRPPVVFVSYSWTTPEHEDWVLELASELRASHRLDVRIDKWHLPTGGDALRFMEEGIRDADKVLIVSDCEYARKANGRRGGAGVEAQILTPELYAQGGGDDAGGALPKYAVALTEYRSDPETGRRVACTPAFYGGRIYIDFADPAQRPARVEDVARWAHDRPVHVAPPIGGRPDFLDDGPNTGTAGVRSRALGALVAARPDAVRAAEDYFDRFATGLLAFAPTLPGPDDPVPDDSVLARRDPHVAAIVRSADRLGAAYGEAEGVLDEVARVRLGERGHNAVRRLFSALLPYVEAVGSLPGGGHLDEWQRWPYRYAIADLFRAAVAALVRSGDFQGVAALTMTYTVPDPSPRVRGLATRSYRSLRRGSHQSPFGDADLYGLRTGRPSRATLSELTQADYLLYLASVAGETSNDPYSMPEIWYPDLLEEHGHRGPLPTFVQAASRRHLNQLAGVIDADGSEMTALIDRVLAGVQGGAGWAIPGVQHARLTDRLNLGTQP